MRVGVIRGDLPGPLFLADLEPMSQVNVPVDPVGQTRYVSRPDPTALTTYMASVPAGIQGTAVTFPLSIHTGGGINNALRVKNTLAGSFVAVTIASSSYTTMALLVAAANVALSGSGVLAATDSTGTMFVLQSTIGGVGSYVAVDTTGSGSTANVALGLSGAGQTFTMPAAAAIINALNPVGGPLNVSPALLLTTLGAGPAATALADKIAPKFVETDVALKSFAVGNMSQYLASQFTPDPHRLPPLATGPAISVVQDDGVTAFAFGLPIVSGAVHNSPNTGDLTIAGTGLGNSEFVNATTVRVTDPVTKKFAQVEQKLIAATVSGGTTGLVTATSIIIPASLLHGLGVVGSVVQLKYTTLASNTFITT